MNTRQYVGLYGSAKAWMVAEYARKHPRILVLCADQKQAEGHREDLNFFLGPDRTLTLSAWDTLPFEAVSPQALVSAERLHSLTSIHKASNFVCIASVEALLQRILDVKIISRLCFQISRGTTLSREQLVTLLDRGGYQRVSLVEELGEFAVRGQVIDLHPPGFDLPIRIEYLTDVIEKIKSFDPESQRSQGTYEQVSIIPVREILSRSIYDDDQEMCRSIVERIKQRGRELDTPPREIAKILTAFRENTFYPGVELMRAFGEPLLSCLDYFPNDCLLVINDAYAVSQSAESYWELVNEREQRFASEHYLIPSKEALYLSPSELTSSLSKFEHIYLDQLAISTAPGEHRETDPEVINLRSYAQTELVERLKAQVGSGEAYRPLIDQLQRWRKEGFRVAIVIGSKIRAERVHKLLLEYGIDARIEEGSCERWLNALQPYPIVVLSGGLSQGFVMPGRKLVFVAEQEIFARRSVRSGTVRKKSLKQIMSALAQLKSGNFIVHEDYGIGHYQGLMHLEIEGAEGDFLSIQYADSKLYLPVQNISRIQKYVGPEGVEPALDKLGSNRWAKTKKKIRDSIVVLAGDLLKLYAARSVARGWRFEPVGAEDERFADGFAYDETPDQASAIDATLSDMAKDQPMDRLVCGDVGFGKTEVALRAAFKCLQHARQVAVLVPTTILVEQHLRTFKERFAEYDVKVAGISRFYSAAENKRTLEQLAAGKVDLIIGTHALLSKRVVFKDVGLLIIDEEHRFGVKQKERLKQLKTQVDVLALTATPIPRTLHMSLLNIRDISVISTPPADRRVIRTYVATRSDALVRDAMLREHQRGGQVFFVHNRVESIYGIAAGLRELVPELRFECAHGQMSESELEPVMKRFINKELDVLVCTSIIESGLDIPNANTIIIDRADAFGLAQLYQLRGRVGRSHEQAYAYLLVPHSRRLGVEAQERLKVLQSLDDLGLGFNLALRDLEIRGAGNLLGREQSGHVSAIGYDLYMKILREAVLYLKGDQLELEETVDPEVKFRVNAYLPEAYIPDVSERLVIYQRLAALITPEEADDLAFEISDRFGPYGNEVADLIELMRYRGLLRIYGISSAELHDTTLTFSFGPRAALDPQKILALVEREPERYRLGRNLLFKVQLKAEERESLGALYSLTRGLLFSLRADEQERATIAPADVVQ